MKIGVDVDGVLRDLPKKVREISKREWNYNAPETREWGDIEKVVPPEQDVWNILYDSKFSKEIMLGAEETLMAQSIGNFVNNLRDKMNVLIIITTMQKDLAKEFTIQWLNNHFINPFWDKIEFLSGEQRVLGNFDLAFEDNPLAVKGYLKKGTAVVMPKYKYNENEFIVGQPNLEIYEPNDWSINLKYFVRRWLNF